MSGQAPGVALVVGLALGVAGSWAIGAARADCGFPTETLTLELVEAELVAGDGDLEAEAALWEGTATFNGYGLLRVDVSGVLLVSD